MKELMQNLLKLQAINFAEPPEKKSEAEVEKLRALIPPQILGHYDRLVTRGKKGVAIVRNQVCTGCHMRLPIGTINTLMQGVDVQLCDSCGRYLCLAETDPEPVVAVEPPKPARKPRKKKVPLLHASA